MEKVHVRSSSIHGKGVFAKEKIGKGEIIEVCPVLIFLKEELACLDKTSIYNYYFQWKKIRGALALGYGSLYNHSYSPNAKYEKDEKQEQIIFTAIKDIQIGEEIIVNYNGDPSLKDTLWFDAR